MESGCSDVTHCESGRLETVGFTENSERRSHTVNQIKAIDKKLLCSERQIIDIEETGGGIKIMFNAGTYELVNSVIP